MSNGQRECSQRIDKEFLSRCFDDHDLTFSFIRSSLFHHQLVHITPSPPFPWLNRADDRMGGRVKVFRGVLVLGGIAAADVAASKAHSQMDPAVLHFQTLLAAGGARLDVADLVEMDAGLLGHDHTSLRYSCTNWTAIAPSPTAEATRLTESDRTSPAANTPARLVSSRNGCRFPVQCGDCASDGPVMMKPLASRSISGGSQSVRGTAPIKLNTAGVSTVRFSPVLLLTISMELRWPSPFIRCTVELRSNSMLGVCSIRLAR